MHTDTSGYLMLHNASKCRALPRLDRNEDEPVTCPTLLRHPLAGSGADVRNRAQQLRARAARLRARLRGDSTGAQFARYVVVGGVSSLLYAIAFLAADGLGQQTANLIGAVISTLVANELHRRLTFHAGQRVSWLAAQWEAGGIAAVGLVATSLALAGATTLIGATSQITQLALVYSVTGLIGLVRFVALRSWVFGTSS